MFRFTSRIRILNIEYANEDDLCSIMTSYLQIIVDKKLPNHRVWKNPTKTQQLASSMVQVTTLIVFIHKSCFFENLFKF